MKKSACLMKSQLFLFLFCLVIIPVGCQDNEDDQYDHNHDRAINHSKRVSGIEIPDIIDFIKQKTNESLTIQLQGIPGTREPDLVLSTILTEDVLVISIILPNIRTGS